MKRLNLSFAIIAAFLCISAFLPGVASADNKVGFLVSSCTVEDGRIVINGVYNNVTDLDAEIWGTDVEVKVTDPDTEDVIFQGRFSFDMDLWVPANTAQQHTLIINNESVFAPPGRYTTNVKKTILQDHHYRLH